MRAWSLVENHQPLEARELATPIPVGTQVLLQITHCGVCHSDLHIWEGSYDLGGGEKLSLADRGVKLPLVMGHEIVGRVVSVGPDVKSVKLGEWRIAYPWIGCGTCAACREGHDNMCVNSRTLGIMQNGGFASHVLVPDERYLVDPGSLDPAVAATYACSGITVYSAIAKVMPLPAHEPVVLIGAGGLGLNAISILRAKGHVTIIVVDTGAEKRDAALAAGASAVIDGGDEAVQQKIVEICGAQPKAIIDLVNSSETARMSLAVLRKGGTLVQVGLFGGELRLQLPVMATKALTIRGSYVGSLKDLRELVELAQNGKVSALPVEKLPLEKVNDALNRLRGGKVTGRLVLTCDSVS